MNLRSTSAALLALGLGASCNPPTTTPGPPPAVSPGDAPPATSTAAATTPDDDPSAAVPTTPIPPGERRLLVPPGRLAALRAKVQGKAPEWAALKAVVDAGMGAPPDWNRGSAENAAVAYLMTGEKAYAEEAFRWVKASMAQDVRSGSYLEFGNLMKPAAMVLDLCAPALDAAKQKELVDYLARWTEELWFKNQGSGWGLADAGNNYHMAFIEGTAFAAYALQRANHPQAKRYLDVLFEKLDKPNGVIAYLNGRGKGGDWHEGANYGQRAKQRLYMALAAIVSMGGPDYFSRSPFFAESIYFAVYQLQPGETHIHPSGDLARDVGMPVTPFDRDYVQLATFFTKDKVARGLGRWYLTKIAPSYIDEKSFKMRGALYRDLLFAMDGAATPPSQLPLAYQAKGTGFVGIRSAWDAKATSLVVSAGGIIDQSHAHLDTGSFTLWKEGWQAPDAVSYGRSGLNWEPGAHNMVHIAGSDRFFTNSRGLVSFSDDPSVSYLQVDASSLYRHRTGGPGTEVSLADECTRELVYLKPDTLVVYDRVAPTAHAKELAWRLHLPSKPAQSGARFTSTNGRGSLALVSLLGGAATVAQDTDLTADGSNAFRVQVPPPDASKKVRFLHVLQVASGAPPALAAERISSQGGAVDGAVIKDQVVVFSTSPLGKPAPLGFSYTVPGTDKRTHTLSNMSGPCAVQVSRAGGSTTVTVSAGSKYTASAAGVVRFTE